MLRGAMKSRSRSTPRRKAARDADEPRADRYADKRERLTAPVLQRMLARIRAVCLALPETAEVEAWGHPTFRVADKIFAGFTPDSVPVSTGLINARKTLLDAVASDARDLKKVLGATDRVRLDAHLASISSLEKSMAAVAEVACEVPPKPGPRPGDMDGMKEPLAEV